MHAEFFLGKSSPTLEGFPGIRRLGVEAKAVGFQKSFKKFSQRINNTIKFWADFRNLSEKFQKVFSFIKKIWPKIFLKWNLSIPMSLTTNLTRYCLIFLFLVTFFRFRSKDPFLTLRWHCCAMPVSIPPWTLPLTFKCHCILNENSIVLRQFLF